MEVRVGEASVFRPERWGVLACKGSTRKLLSPAYFRGNYDGQNQAAGAIKFKLGTDPYFRKKYDGWFLYPIRLDAGNCFKVKA
jgi:hypothetical protein